MARSPVKELPSMTALFLVRNLVLSAVSHDGRERQYREDPLVDQRSQESLAVPCLILSEIEPCQWMGTAASKAYFVGIKIFRT